MKTLFAALALALAAPAGAGQLTLTTPAAMPAAIPAAVPAPVPALGATLPQLAAAPAAPALSAKLLAAEKPTDVLIKTPAFAWMTTERALAAVPSFQLQNLGAAAAVSAPAASAGDAHRLSVGFDGTDKRLMAPVDPNGGSFSSSFSGGGSGLGGSGSGGSSGGSGGSGGLSALVAKIEATGQVRPTSDKGDAIKVIAPKIEQTANGGTLYAVALVGKVDGQGNFTKTGLMAVSQSKEMTQAPAGKNRTRAQSKESSTNIAAGLDGKAATISEASSDHVDVIEVTQFPGASKQAAWQKELAAAQAATGVSDLKGLLSYVQQNGSLDQEALSQGMFLIGVTIENSVAADGTEVEVKVGVDPMAGRLILIRHTRKGQPTANGLGDTARKEQTVYVADGSGALQEATHVGTDHSLDVERSDGPADPLAQLHFDDIVAKLLQP